MDELRKKVHKAKCNSHMGVLISLKTIWMLNISIWKLRFPCGNIEFEHNHMGVLICWKMVGILDILIWQCIILGCMKIHVGIFCFYHKILNISIFNKDSHEGIAHGKIYDMGEKENQCGELMREHVPNFLWCWWLNFGG